MTQATSQLLKFCCGYGCIPRCCGRSHWQGFSLYALPGNACVETHGVQSSLEDFCCSQGACRIELLLLIGNLQLCMGHSAR